MTYQALILLHQIKKTQINIDGEIWLDEDNRKMSTVVEVNAKCIETDLSSKWNSVKPTLTYLCETKLLQYNGQNYYSLTYSGFHYTQSIATSIVNFLFRSIFVPITVSGLTTIVLFVIERWLTK